MITVEMEAERVNLGALTKINSASFQFRLLLLILLITILITITLLTGGVIAIVAMILLGFMYAHGIELQHQCLHHTAYRRKSWNRVVGVSLGLPLLVSFSDYQVNHFRHHRLLGTPEDKEFFNYSYESLNSPKVFIPHIFMLRHYYDVVIYIWRAARGRATRSGLPLKTSLCIRNEYMIIAAFLVSMLAISIWFQTALYIYIWLIPFLVGVPVHALIELPEHFGCDGRTTDILRNTRTIKASKLATWFTNGNNFHVEHHWLPSVPNDKFKDIHQIVAHQIHYLEPSYWSFYRRFFLHLFRKNARGRW